MGYICWRAIGAPVSDDELIRLLERIRDLMVAVSTGGPRIQSVNPEFREAYVTADFELQQRGISNPIPFSDLWEWYGRWSSGDLPSWQSRRDFLSELFTPLIAQVRAHAVGQAPRLEQPTGWTKVDRTVGEIRRRLAEPKTEEQFQTVGLLCREVLISLSQAVYDPERHPAPDGVDPSSTDAKRMLSAYLAVEFAGGSNEVVRRHARASVDLAVQLQHRRTATFREAALCAEATTSVINVVAIISGHRDPVTPSP
jgi:hypothetical protein